MLIKQRSEAEMSNSEQKKVITTDNAPKAIGPYSVAIKLGSLVFTSGQVGINPQTSEIVTGGIEAETRQVLTNVKHVLEAAGTSLGQVVKTTVFLQTMADFSTMNAVYAEYFPDDPPARSTIAVAGLPKGALVEIETIATTE
ncbi:MAG: RidA family protein [Chloroflexota bacterium]